MNYISKGMVLRESTEDLLFVTHCGAEYQLTGMQADLWLNGRFGVSHAHDMGRDALQKLKHLDLVEIIEDDDRGNYDALTHCHIVPARLNGFGVPLTKCEKVLLRWLIEAGLHLTMAELVYLHEHNITPCKELLGPSNRQVLTECIYTSETIFDNVLESQMASAASRDTVVQAVLSLLRKKRILLL